MLGLDMPILFTGLTVAALLVLLVGERRGRGPLIYVIKPLASTGFLATAWSLGALESDFGVTIFVGLMLSMVGDVCLLSRARGPFLAGLVAFLLAHVAYAFAFVMRDIDPLATAAAAAGLTVVSVLVARWLLPHVEGAMKAPVRAYVLVITVMVALAAGTVALNGEPLILVAAVLFYGSDLFVARERFVTQGFVNRALGLPLYYAGQLVFAWTVAGA